MQNRTRLLESSGEFFHLYNRGVNRERIYFSDSDYLQFTDLLNEKLDRDELLLHAYVLMPNHFHLILQQLVPRAMSTLQKITCEAYAKSTNKQRTRTGHLFQSRYKLKHIQDQRYLMHLSRYIHLNPVQAHLVDRPEDWRFSSCNDFRQGGNNGFVTTDVILAQAGGVEKYWQYLHQESPGYGEDIENYLIDKELL